jgi:hypothetical protein
MVRSTFCNERLLTSTATRCFCVVSVPVPVALSGFLVLSTFGASLVCVLLLFSSCSYSVLTLPTQLQMKNETVFEKLIKQIEDRPECSRLKFPGTWCAASGGGGGGGGGGGRVVVV